MFTPTGGLRVGANNVYNNSREAKGVCFTIPTQLPLQIVLTNSSSFNTTCLLPPPPLLSLLATAILKIQQVQY